MILGLAEENWGYPREASSPSLAPTPRVVPDSRSTYATVAQNLSRIVLSFRSERLAGVVSRLTTFVPAALAWSFAIRAKNQPPRCKTVNTSTTPQADQLVGIIPKRLA